MITVGKFYTAEVIEEDGELALDIPDELMETMNWKVGDTLRWEQAGEAWILSKVKDNESTEET
jgi:hypothetical protein